MAGREAADAAALRFVFDEIFDRDSSGHIELGELTNAMARFERSGDAAGLLAAADKDADGRISFGEFRGAVEQSAFFRSSRRTFDALDADGNGKVTAEEVQRWLVRELKDVGEEQAAARAAELVRHWGRSKSGEAVSFPEFFLFVTTSAGSLPLLHALGGTGGLPAHGLSAPREQSIEQLAELNLSFGDVWGRYGVGVYGTPGKTGKHPLEEAKQASKRRRREEEKRGQQPGSAPAEAKEPALFDAAYWQAFGKKFGTLFWVGGMSGTVAKTVIAPADRIKILFQTSDRSFSLGKALSEAQKIVADEGVAALWKGHSTNVIRVLPYAGIHFASHDLFEMLLKPSPGEVASADPRGQLSTSRKFACGAMAGAIPTTITYPLDMVRAKMAIKTGKVRLLGVTRQVVAESGVRGLFKGLSAGLIGIVPYSGTAWTVKGHLGERLPHLTGRTLNPTVRPTTRPSPLAAAHLCADP